MSTNKELKAQKIAEIRNKISDSKSLVLVEYKGITVEQDTALRAKFRAADVEYTVLKNRLLKRAFNELGYDDFDGQLENTTAVAFAKSDALAPAKIVMEANKSYKVILPKCGMMDGKYVDAKTVETLSAIPGKEVLLAQLLGLLQSGLSGLARALVQIAEQKQ